MPELFECMREQPSAGRLALVSTARSPLAPSGPSSSRVQQSTLRTSVVRKQALTQVCVLCSPMKQERVKLLKVRVRSTFLTSIVSCDKRNDFVCRLVGSHGSVALVPACFCWDTATHAANHFQPQIGSTATFVLTKPVPRRQHP